MRDPRNLDTRAHASPVPAVLSAFDVAAEAASASLPGDHTVHAKGVNPVTRSAQRVLSVGAPVEPEIMQSPSLLVRRALDHLASTSQVMGFEAVEEAEFIADPNVSRTTGGAAAVHTQQLFHGVPVFDMSRTVSFSREGQIEEVSGQTVSPPPDLDVVPKIGAVDAVRAAATYVATPPPNLEPELDPYGEPVELGSVDLSDFASPQVVAAFDVPSRPTVIEKGPFETHPKAELVVFFTAPDFRLGWRVELTLRDYSAQFEVIVAADVVAENPEILYCQNTLQAMEVNFQARVYVSRPATDGTDARMLVTLPRPVTDYPAEAPPTLPPTFPFTWVDQTKKQTLGNSTIAVKGTSMTSFAGTLDGSDVVFAGMDPLDDDQKVTNIFYYCNYMHDFFYLLGFDEAAGNFQQVHSGTGGRAGDPVVARAHPGAVTGTANMATQPDGTRGLMNMGLVTRSGRHTAFEADVVFHEYTHGVSNRLVGGPLNANALRAPQCRGMGEGWSDFYALTIANFGTATERTVIADWVVDKAGGIRSAPYDENFPRTFGSLPNLTHEHPRGEVWCATLMQMTRNFEQELGDRARAYRLAWRVVLDGMKLTPANPSFLDARNAIYRALDAMIDVLTDDELTRCRAAARRAFAKFGMGTNASCPSAELLDIVEDFTEA
jgi:extracellular elastinolytic metalloproteinase